MTMRYQGVIPKRIAKLRVDARGYPVPWFVAWVNGVPDFRIVEAYKVAKAIRNRLCWVCGEVFAHEESAAFVIGPMCGVNRISAEPPLHLQCAVFSVQACPFLTLPKARRREGNMPDMPLQEIGVMHPRNPGVSIIWLTDSFTPFRAPNARSRFGAAAGTIDSSGWMFELGEPIRVDWYTEGRRASRDESVKAIESGMLILREAAQHDDAVAECTLDYWRDELNKWLPPHEAAPVESSVDG